jgi:hypothetical protein
LLRGWYQPEAAQPLEEAVADNLLSVPAKRLEPVAVDIPRLEAGRPVGAAVGIQQPAGAVGVQAPRMAGRPHMPRARTRSFQ